MMEREGVRIYVAYFDRELGRRVRRVPLSLAVKSPTLKELEEACRTLGYRFNSTQAKHSAVWWMDVGAVEVSGVKKQQAIRRIAQEILRMRSAKGVKA